MAKETFERSLADLREENEEMIFSGNGNVEEFMDMLDTTEKEQFQQMAEIAEQKKKWLRRFEKMTEAIAARDFDEAYASFEVLANDLFE